MTARFDHFTGRYGTRVEGVALAGVERVTVSRSGLIRLHLRDRGEVFDGLDDCADPATGLVAVGLQFERVDDEGRSVLVGAIVAHGDAEVTRTRLRRVAAAVDAARARRERRNARERRAAGGGHWSGWR